MGVTSQPRLVLFPLALRGFLIWYFFIFRYGSPSIVGILFPIYPSLEQEQHDDSAETQHEHHKYFLLHFADEVLEAHSASYSSG